MFPPDDPIAQEAKQQYLDAWKALTPALRNRLRAGLDRLEPDEVEELLALPHPRVTLTKWVDVPESEAWNVTPNFMWWAQDEAPAEEEF